MIELTLPYPPSINHAKRVGRTIRTKRGKILQMRVNSDATKRFYWESHLIIKSEMVSRRMETPLPATIALRVEIDMHPPDKRRTDVDSRIKLILDCLERGGLIENDYQIACLLVTRKAIISQGSITVRITPYAQP